MQPKLPASGAASSEDKSSLLDSIEFSSFPIKKLKKL